MKRNQMLKLPALSLLVALQLSACAPAAGPVSPNPVKSDTPSGSTASGQSGNQTPAQDPIPAEPLPEAKIESLNGIWAEADGTRYYLRHSQTRVFIYAENTSGNIPWSMAGMVSLEDSQNFQNMLTVLYSIPRGLSAKSQNYYAMSLKGAKLELKLVKGNGKDHSLSLQKPLNLPQIYQPKAAAVAVANPGVDLTGRWKGNDGGMYYLRQVGNIVIWYGENDPTKPGWANMAFGMLSDTMVTLNWADMPKAAAVGSGLLKLNIKDENTLELASTEGNGFGGSKWERVLLAEPI